MNTKAKSNHETLLQAVLTELERANATLDIIAKSLVNGHGNGPQRRSKLPTRPARVSHLRLGDHRRGDRQVGSARRHRGQVAGLGVFPASPHGLRRQHLVQPLHRPEGRKRPQGLCPAYHLQRPPPHRQGPPRRGNRPFAGQPVASPPQEQSEQPPVWPAAPRTTPRVSSASCPKDSPEPPTVAPA